MRSFIHTPIAALAALVFLTGMACSGDVLTDVTDEVVIDRVASEEATFRVVQLAEGLEHPWAVAWLPDGAMLITERLGRLNLMRNGEITQVSGLPEIEARGQGGLLDIAPHPAYADNGWIYFTYSALGDGGTATMLARAQLDGSALTDLEVLYEQTPAVRPGRHYGSRIGFLPDGTIVFSIGDRGQRERAQQPNDPSGSVLRLHMDGSIPDDNPWVGDDDYRPELYTMGNRNQQGLIVHPATGQIWAHEHGPRGGDELNLIEAGQNYGWPEASYGNEYRSNAPIGVDPDETDMFVRPVTQWTPSIAPSGLAYYEGDAFPGWQGNLFVGALAYQQINRVVLDGEEVVHKEVLLDNQLGRIRDVRTGPDGLLYVLTDASDGGLFRMEPVE
ncbi:MAG: PQQ-dependent sugar dehydrogenase [Bacteroidetes bacterium]|jgi:glucose/arabinose dehydrogenase|nr:PQQ-dependent sugar dehydrogenase [Bacteroidota bacterium]